MKVEKRDGTIQPFKFKKIEAAVTKVFVNKPVSEPVPDKFIEQLRDYFNALVTKQDLRNPNYAMPIEEIQDIIRDFLIKKNKTKAAESFIKYRAERERIREQKSWTMREVTRKIRGNDVENQNANLDEASFGGRIGEASRVVTKDFALKYIVSKMSRDNHNGNMIYIHDLDSYAVGMHNCLTIPFDKLLKNGFKTRQTDVRPANSLNTAFQLVAVIFQLQSLQQFGGVSASHLDWTMVPYVRKSFLKHYIDGLHYLKGEDKIDLPDTPVDELSIEDSWYGKYSSEYGHVYNYALEMTVRECHQAVEGMYHNLNTLQSRSGNQLPFTSINYGTCTLPEGRMVIKEILEVSIEGLGEFGRTSIFPCGIFQYMKGVNDKPGTPNYDLKQLALKSTSKRLYPNYANCDWTANKSWVELDRKQKEEYINSLSEEQKEKIIALLEKHPEYKQILDLEIIEIND